MSQLDHFHSVEGEETQLTDQELSVNIQASSFAFVRKLTEEMAPASSDMKKYLAQDLYSASMQTIQNKRVCNQTIKSTYIGSVLQRLWQLFTTVSDHSQRQSYIDTSLKQAQDPALLKEMLSHMQHLLESELFFFSSDEQKRILEAAECMAQQKGLFSLGLLVFLSDRHPKELMQLIETPRFSQQQLYKWVKQEGSKTLQSEIAESMKHDNLSSIGVSEQLAKTMSNVLITHVGLCNSGLLEDLSRLMAFIPSSSQFSQGEFYDLLRSRLQLLRDVSLRQKIESLSPPTGDKSGAQCIRETWNMPPDEPITCQNARKTLLATFLSHLRQQPKQEDCFAMALIISVMEESPLQAMEDLSSLLFKGFLKRKIDGKDVIFPWLYIAHEKKTALPLQNAWKQVVASMSETPRQGLCVEKFDAAVMPLFKELSLDQNLAFSSSVQRLLRDTFRWIYEPSILNQEGSQGAFFLYHLQGEKWTKITTAQGLTEALELFVKERWPEEAERLKKQELMHAKLYTEGVVLSLINRYRDAFNVGPVSKDTDYSKLHCAPWVTYTRGNTEFVWRTYREDQPSARGLNAEKPLSIIPKKGEQLIVLLVDWLTWHMKQHLTLKMSHRPIVRIEDVHAFDLLLAPSLLEISKGSLSAEEWVYKRLKQPLLPLSQAPASGTVFQKLTKFVSQNLLTRENMVVGQKELALLDSRLPLYVLRSRLCAIALQGRKGDLTQLRREVENKIDKRILQLLAPEEKKLLESHALIVGDSNWGDDRGNRRYFYLAMHPGSRELSLFLGDVARGDYESLNFVLLPSYPWLNKQWQLLDTHKSVNEN